MSRTTSLLLAGLIALAASACSTTDTVTLESPSGTLTPVQATPSGPTPSGPTARPRIEDVPSLVPASPPPHSLAGASGAILSAAEGTTVTLSFTTMDPYSFLAEAPALSSLSFVDAQGDALSIGGQLKKGTFKTSSDLSLAITVLQPPLGPVTLASGDGSCRVTITSASNVDVAGSFACHDIHASKRSTFDVAATFSGTVPFGG